MSTTDIAPDAPRPRADDPAHATHAAICVLRLEAELAALRETAAALVEVVETLRAENRRLAAELAVEHARWDWMEAGGNVHRWHGQWAAHGSMFSPDKSSRRYRYAATPREAIDMAMTRGDGMSTDTDALATHADDPAAPLVAYIEAAARRRLGGISDECKLVGRMMDCPDVTVGDLRKAVAAIRERDAEIKRLRDGCARDNEDVCQALGRALGYPRFADDQSNFPGATDAHGVCVGEHVAASLAMEAAGRIGELEAEVERIRTAVRTHYEQRADDRCHLDDDKLYHDAFGVGPDPYVTALPPKADMLASCERYIDQRQHPEVAGSAMLPGCMTIAQLTAEVERLGAENKALRTDLDAACSVFSKRTWVGRLDLPFAWHVARGRKMATLKAEAGRESGEGDDRGNNGGSRGR